MFHQMLMKPGGVSCLHIEEAAELRRPAPATTLRIVNEVISLFSNAKSPCGEAL